MIQEIAPHIYNNQYQPVLPDEKSIALYFSDKRVLVEKGENGIRFPLFKELEVQNNTLYTEAIFLFSIDNTRFFLVSHLNSVEGLPYQMEDIELFRTASPQYLSFAGITGYQLYNWYRSHRFCGRCGRPMEHDKKERMMLCRECNLQEYPKLSPAVIVAITNGNKLLMTKYAGRTYKNYALIAGFAEIGETIEETVKREVMEEVGLKVKNLRYYKSQPWSFTDTLLFGFFAQLEGDDAIYRDKEELALAEWFEREEIPDNDSTISLTNEMIRLFKEGAI